MHPVLDLPPLKFDIPFPEMAEIDLTYPLVGLDWVLYPWTVTKGFIMELYSQLNTLHSQLQTGLTEYVPSDRWFELLGYLGIGVVAISLGVLSYYVVSELIYGIGYLWKKLR